MVSDPQAKELAINVIKRLWPDVVINNDNVTPDVATYVFLVFAQAKEGDRAVKILYPALGLATSWTGIGIKLIQAVRGYMQANNWGLAIRAGVAAHRRHVDSALRYGTDVYPLQFR